MDEPLRLEYTCTPAELEEAQNLVIRQRVGGGSGWLAMVVLLLALAAVLLALYLAVEPKYRPYVFGLLLVTWVIATLRQRHKRRKPRSPMSVELTDHDIRITSSSGRAILPWSAVSEFVESDSLFVLTDRTSTVLFAFPKRAFPDQRSCEWFRAAATSAPAVSPEQPDHGEPVPGPRPKAGTVTLDFRLRYRDYLDRSLASWFTRGLMVLFGAMIVGAFLAAMRKPVPNPGFSGWQVFLFFTVPFLALMETMVVFVAATHDWLAHRRHLVTQTVTLSELGLSYRSVGGDTTTVWETPTCYKETPWSFIVWWPGTRAWLQLPKRAFPSVNEIGRCREILAMHAKQSTWYLW